ADAARPARPLRYVLWASVLGGFGVRIEISGARTFIARYRAEGAADRRGKRQGEPMKPQTKSYTIARLRHHVVPLLGHKRVTDILPGDIENFVRDVAAGKSASDEKKGPRRRIVVRGGEGAAGKAVRALSA